MGNTSQDALALTAVTPVGYITDRVILGDARIKTRIEYMGLGAIETDAVLRLVEDAIREPLRVTADESQVIVGPLPGVPSPTLTPGSPHVRRQTLWCNAHRRPT